jgi:hypothetical protein
MTTFQRRLDTGKVGEGLISGYFQSLGHSVMPVYEMEKSVGKGPQLFRLAGDLILPDMLILGGKITEICFAEAKHKSVFSWHRMSKQWTTGIDERHYHDYCEVEAATGVPVWLFFFHREDVPSQSDRTYGCPAECPTGLFGAKLEHLRESVNHRAPSRDVNRAGMVGHGNSGMVYWAESTLRRVASREEVLAAQPMPKAGNTPSVRAVG